MRSKLRNIFFLLSRVCEIIYIYLETVHSKERGIGMKTIFSRLVWGVFLLLAAALVLVSQFHGFAKFGFTSIVILIVSLVLVVYCFAHLRFALLPLPVAALYVIFQPFLKLPAIAIWPLVLTAVLASIGLACLLPRRYRF